MELIKQAWESNGSAHATVFTRGYTSVFSHIKGMVSEARADYPDLKDEDIRIVVYSGSRRNGMVGIEFEVEEIKDGYFVVNSPEPTYN